MMAGLKMYFILGVIFVCCVQYVDMVDVVINEIWSVEGDKARLPCRASPRKVNDRPILILWYKSTSNKPIYSYDARYSKYAAGERFYNATVFGDRAYFVPMSTPSALILNPVVPSDRGSYICRLDYADSPTTSDRSNLMVIETPLHPEVFHENVRVVGAVGPVGENSTVQLACMARGGNPKPTVVWWIEGAKASGQKLLKSVKKNETRTAVTLRATRDLNLKKISCIVQMRIVQNITVTPLAESVYLNITLPPLGISIEGPDENIAEGTTLSLTCLSWGAYPSVIIKWWKAGREITNLPVSVKDGGNITTKSLKITVKRSDHGSSFTCRSANPELSDKPLVLTKRLNVTFKPLVQLHAKIPTNFVRTSSGIPGKPGSATVKSGSHIRFECSLNANPSPTLIEWRQNGIVIASGKNSWSYLLDNVSKEHSGVYTCIAANTFGRGSSFPYTITVEHPPECREGWHQRTQGVEIGTTITVLCRVEAIPDNDITFTWAKALADSTRVQFSSKSIDSDGLTSRLKVAVDSIADLGVIMCGAKNSVGDQMRTCDTNLVAASPPNRPANCSSEPGRTGYAVVVSCIEGFDGGFPQKFVLVAKQDGNWIANVTREFPEWILQDLKPKTIVQIQIQAVNIKGASELSYLKVIPKLATLMKDEATKLSEEEYSKTVTMPIIAIIVGLGGALSVIALVIATFVCSSRKKNTNTIRTIYATPCPIKPGTGVAHRNGKSFSKGDQATSTYMVVDAVSCLRTPELKKQYENLIIRGLQCSSDSSSESSKHGSIAEEDITDLRQQSRKVEPFYMPALETEQPISTNGDPVEEERTYANCIPLHCDESCTEYDDLLHNTENIPSMGIIYVPSTNYRKMMQDEKRKCKYGQDNFSPEGHTLLNATVTAFTSEGAEDNRKGTGRGKLEELRKLLCSSSFQREGSVVDEEGRSSSTYQKFNAICPYELAITPTLENIDSVIKQNFGSIPRRNDSSGGKISNNHQLPQNSRDANPGDNEVLSNGKQFNAGHIYEKISPNEMHYSANKEALDRNRSADKRTYRALQRQPNLIARRLANAKDDNHPCIPPLQVAGHHESEDDTVDVGDSSSLEPIDNTERPLTGNKKAISKCIPLASSGMPTYLTMNGEAPQFIENISSGRCNVDRDEMDKLFENCTAFSWSRGLSGHNI